MPRINDPNYFFETSSEFQLFAWFFFILQLAGVFAGLYLLFADRGTNALQRKRFRQLSYALLGLGGIGLIFAVLRLNDIAPFTMRLWFWLMLALEAGFAGYVFYYARFRYTKELSTIHTDRGKTRSRAPAPRSTSVQAHPVTTSGGSTKEEPASQETRGGRRESRHRRKRKGR